MEYKPRINSDGGLIPAATDVSESDKIHIEIKDVKFSYPTKKDVQVLKGLNLEV